MCLQDTDQSIAVAMGVSLVKLSVTPRLCPTETLVKDVRTNCCRILKSRSSATLHLAPNWYMAKCKGSGLRRQNIMCILQMSFIPIVLRYFDDLVA